MTRLSEVEARAAAATEGPWQIHDWDDHMQIGYAKGYIATVLSDERGKRDAEFIIAARSDVPALCALARQLGDALAQFSDLDKVNDGSAFLGAMPALAAYREWVDG